MLGSSNVASMEGVRGEATYSDLLKKGDTFTWEFKTWVRENTVVTSDTIDFMGDASVGQGTSIKIEVLQDLGGVNVFDSNIDFTNYFAIYKNDEKLSLTSDDMAFAVVAFFIIPVNYQNLSLSVYDYEKNTVVNKSITSIEDYVSLIFEFDSNPTVSKSGDLITMTFSNEYQETDYTNTYNQKETIKFVYNEKSGIMHEIDYTGEGYNNEHVNIVLTSGDVVGETTGTVTGLTLPIHMSFVILAIISAAIPLSTKRRQK